MYIYNQKENVKGIERERELVSSQSREKHLGREVDSWHMLACIERELGEYRESVKEREIEHFFNALRE